jgi:hypothetical protein
MAYRSLHDTVCQEGTGALKASDVVVGQLLHDSEAKFGHGQNLANKQVLIGVRGGGLEAKAPLALAKRSLKITLQ